MSVNSFVRRFPAIHPHDVAAPTPTKYMGIGIYLYVGSRQAGVRTNRTFEIAVCAACMHLQSCPTHCTIFQLPEQVERALLSE
jgi:hypothetical protein